ncbi:4-diphosphocytidyl-2-C-methyl-D-erythritol kinase, chloroplastic [Galdieria sulphuraria]|uniref:4-(cytidine 5'-diphospho)-2-C-methyl-D-erythritol kinase n=1 Tax=Galdieria sulphuraria TaxID=130081 RepID=M2W2D0_GALSU|nr:4-diphosphocytidyl-2-C-methyl-D-erythritol kinase [Galdieria sulphuraria]EME29841.1 4-diphosphocytidyl-2-C-methyl-D-erythritol kinase [Galdieria sulphuraria]GJD06830.1 4-diphosphocytidyl-2-C-methyl-D-erythritol kinase, chloroplastic [Galdieria sulphuraria]|eukprot:XP_005706361.1 4-diphosphocytidyl-2-C-methyl-D-erythritol kinase [Galdieria sulphuraria]
MTFLSTSISDSCGIFSTRKSLPCTIRRRSVYRGWKRPDHLSLCKALCTQINATARQEGLNETPTETSMKVEQLLQVEETERSSGNWDIIYESPAKINLFLRILGKRKDGYHNIATLMQVISLRDTLYFKLLDESAEGDIFETDSDEIPIGSSNLVIAAFRKFRKESGMKRYFHTRVEKRIPVKAGLGGGSSNAATALWAANKLTGKKFSTEYLKKWGADLGSDVPFFFSGGTAFCTGRGENVSELPSLFPSFLYIIKPDGSLSTADVYENLDLSNCSTRDPQELITAVQDGIMWAEPMNDLEESSFRLYPLLSELKKLLRACGFPVVLMCGSGSALFCLGAPHSSIYPTFEEKLVKHFPVKVYTARFLNRNIEQDVWYLDPEEIKTNTVVEQWF